MNCPVRNEREVQRQVAALMRAVEVSIAGMRREWSQALIRVERMASVAADWAVRGGEPPAYIQRFGVLMQRALTSTHAADDACGHCAACRASDELARDYMTDLSLEQPIWTAYSWLLGRAQPDIRSGLDELRTTFGILSGVPVSDEVLDSAEALAQEVLMTPPNVRTMPLPRCRAANTTSDFARR